MDYREGPMVSVREFCEIYEIAVPIKKEVCPVCEGHGIHVNPAIDSHGMIAGMKIRHSHTLLSLSTQTKEERCSESDSGLMTIRSLKSKSTKEK